MEESKGGLKSKINLVGVLLVAMSALSDPMFGAYFGQWVPQEWVSRLSFIAGWAIIYFRSNGQANIPVDWKSPWKAKAE